MSAATRVIAACAGLTLALLLTLLAAAFQALILDRAAAGIVGVVFVALAVAAVESRRADRAELAAQARAVQRVAGNALVLSPTESPEEVESQP